MKKKCYKIIGLWGLISVFIFLSPLSSTTAIVDSEKTNLSEEQIKSKEMSTPEGMQKREKP